MNYNEIMVAQAKNRVLRELEESGRVGKNVKTKFTVDKSGEKFDLYGDGTWYVKVSDDVISLAGIASIDVSYSETAHETIENENLLYQKAESFEVVGSRDIAKALLFSGSLGEIHGTFAYVGVDAFCTETTTPIDPKFLPSGEVDFDLLGITNIVLELINASGGDRTVSDDNSYGVDIEAVMQAFPEKGPYVAKLTIPGTGVMRVTPVYTLFGEYGLASAHFDTYFERSTGIIKFYVRVIGMFYPDDKTIDISVGFY